MKMSASNLVPVAVGIVLIGFLVYAFLPKAVPVGMATVTRGPLEVTVDENGKTRIRERYVVSAPLAGTMQRLEIHAGEKVLAGKTLLASIEPTDPEMLDVRAKAEAEGRVKSAAARIQQAQARVAAAREAEELAKHTLDRVSRLLPQKGVSKEEFDASEHRHALAVEERRGAEFGVLVANFETDIAKAAFLRSRPDTKETTRFEIRSPIDGVVLRVFQESAGPITPGMRLLELGDLTDMEVEVDVLSVDAVKIRRGAKARLDHWGGDRPLQARVRMVEPAGFLKVSALGVEEQRVNVLLDLVDSIESRKSLGDAYRVEARIVIWEGADVLKVPAGSLFRHHGSWAVFKVEAGRAKVCPVQAGHSNGLETEILEGLQENEQVIVHPSDKIREGIAVVPR